MKFFCRIVFISIFIELLIFISSIKLKKQEDLVKKICEELDKKDPTPKPDPKPIPNVNLTFPFTDNRPSYIDLVTNPIRPKCPVVNSKNIKSRNLINYEKGDFPARGPQAFKNPFKILSDDATSYINYLWDYLDEMIVKKMNDKKLSEVILKEFTQAFEEAKKVSKVDNFYSNPYTPPKLLFYFSQGAAGTEPFTDPRLISQRSILNSQIATPSGLVPATPDIKPVPDDTIFDKKIYDQISVYNKNFKKEIFENGITPIQVLHILNEWGWGTPGSNYNILEVKSIVDAYDFNGDGNLNPEEFTIFQIHYTLKAGYQCTKHCLRDVINKVFEPLFLYLDCDSDGYINSFNMWEGLKNVFRGKENNKYDMYSCRFPLELNEEYRTNTTNDFILNVAAIEDGYVNKMEFIRGMLTGFWQRLTTQESYGDNAFKNNGLAKRWNPSGTKDIECDKIKLYFDK